jgi:hypothetical protein
MRAARRPAWPTRMRAAVVDSVKPNIGKESTLSRWSRLKRERSVERLDETKIVKNEQTPPHPGAIVLGAEPGSSDPVAATSTENSEANERASSLAESFTLPSLDDVGLEKDFTPFMQAKVPEALKRQALKTLFKDAHFNTMDGLDIYIDDYTQFEPISAAEMEGLSAWKSIMKPLEQVVTPGGYAVDVESEEGKAVLAAREAANELRSVSATGDQGDPLPPGGGGSREAVGEGDLYSSTTVDSEASPSPVAVATPSPVKGEGNFSRYGKRVGDFKPEAMTARESPSLTSRPSPLSLIDDPR